MLLYLNMVMGLITNDLVGFRVAGRSREQRSQAGRHRSGLGGSFGVEQALLERVDLAVELVQLDLELCNSFMHNLGGLLSPPLVGGVAVHDRQRQAVDILGSNDGAAFVDEPLRKPVPRPRQALRGASVDSDLLLVEKLVKVHVTHDEQALVDGRQAGRR